MNCRDLDRTTFFLTLLLLPPAVACGAPGDGGAETEGGTSSDGGGELTGGDGSVTSSGGGDEVGGSDDGDAGGADGGTEGGEVFDCAAVSDAMPHLTVLDGPVAGRGLVFDGAGACIGVSEPHLFRSSYGEQAEIFVPGLGELDQIDILPDGDFALSNYGTGALMRITPEGASSMLATDVFAYGVRVGPDGRVYATNDEAIYRIDPASSTRETYLEPDGFSPRVLDFSRDHTRMYIGTAESGGTVWTLELDGNLDPVAEPALFVDGLGGWHDGLGVDACDNVYVADYDTFSLYRIPAGGGEVVTLLDASVNDGETFGHGLVWGSGIGGWKADALYMPLPNSGDAIGEAVIGVPYRTWPGTVVNVP